MVTGTHDPRDHPKSRLVWPTDPFSHLSIPTLPTTPFVQFLGYTACLMLFRISLFLFFGTWCNLLNKDCHCEECITCNGAYGIFKLPGNGAVVGHVDTKFGRQPQFSN